MQPPRRAGRRALGVASLVERNKIFVPRIFGDSCATLG